MGFVKVALWSSPDVQLMSPGGSWFIPSHFSYRKISKSQMIEYFCLDKSSHLSQYLQGIMHCFPYVTCFSSDTSHLKVWKVFPRLGYSRDISPYCCLSYFSSKFRETLHISLKCDVQLTKVTLWRKKSSPFMGRTVHLVYHLRMERYLSLKESIWLSAETNHYFWWFK